jgi:hypothetical protein
MGPMKDEATPVRIELATSELDGGHCRAWADPAQVLALVAVSSPEETFSHLVEPKLRDLSEPFPAGEPEGAPRDADPGLGGLPLSVRSLVGRVQGIHRTLYQRNRVLRGEGAWVELTCAVAEEDRVYFIKSGSSWVCLLRDGKAHAARARETEAATERPALGRGESLRIEVTSLPIHPGDTVILVTADSEAPADLRAVVNLFAQTSDLKRACDGLVNLLGLQSQSASAVALRFYPVGVRQTRGENPLNALAAELGWKNPFEPSPEIDQLLEGTFGNSEGEGLVEFHRRQEALRPESLWREMTAPPAEDSPAAWPAFPEDSPAARPAPPAESPPVAWPAPPAESSPAARPAAQPEPALATAATIDVPEPATSATEPPPRSWRRLWNRVTGNKLLVLPILFGFFALVAFLAAIPGRSGSARLFAGFGRGATGTGTLDIACDPPAGRVFVDEQPAGEETPVRLASVAAGTHTLGLDLGDCGVWETQVRVLPGKTLRVAPRLTGSVEVSAAAPDRGGSVWLEGSGKTSLPARFDSLPAGWNRIFYEDSRVALWDRMVLVRPSGVAHVIIPNDGRRDEGLIQVESLVRQNRRGLLDSEGDTVWVDGRLAGVTPLESAVSPGLHSVRVQGHGCGNYAEVLDLKPGMARQVLARLTGEPVPCFHHVAPGKVLIRGPLLLSVEITGAVDAAELQPTLHLPELPSGSREIPLSPVDSQKGVYIGAVNAADLPMWRPVSYYFTVHGPGGETVWSDLYKLTPQRKLGSGESSTPPSLSSAGAATEASGSQPAVANPPEARSSADPGHSSRAMPRVDPQGPSRDTGD